MPNPLSHLGALLLALAAATEPALAQSGEGPVPPTFEVTALAESGATVIVGMAEPGATVDILDRNLPIAVAVANRRGEWAIALGDDLEPGRYSLAVRATSPDGRHVLIASQRIEVVIPAPKAVTVVAASEEIVVRRGDTLWDLARRIYGSGVHFDLLFQANRDLIARPGAIFPGQVLAVPALAAPDEDRREN
jgi:nucleoid-associated protein YgaU